MRMNDVTMSKAVQYRKQSGFGALAFVAFVLVALENVRPVKLELPHERQVKEIYRNITPAAIIQQHEKAPASPEASSPLVVIFYNIFVPNAREGHEHSYGIIEDQLGQLEKSDAAQIMHNDNTNNNNNNNNKNQTLLVYYNTIGWHRAAERVQKSCASKSNLNCVHMKHYPEGFEEVTLQELHQFCKDPTTPPHARVVYIHNKGSFHKGNAGVVGGQDYWRRSLTKAATHRDCLQPPLNNTNNNNSTCNYCALHISLIPSVQQHGNMWSAQCGYVRHLLSPLEYRDRNIDIQKQFGLLHAARLRPPNQTMNVNAFGAYGPWGFGQQRFSNEHWVGSHPSVVPCDLNPLQYYTYWQKDDSKLAESEKTNLTFHMLPRRPMSDRPCKPEHDNVAKSLNKTAERKSDFFFMGGMLLRWLMLYQAVPETAENTTEAWAFDAFPDEAFWRQAVAEHGLQVLNVVYNATIPLCKDYHGCGHISHQWGNIHWHGSF